MPVTQVVTAADRTALLTVADVLQLLEAPETDDILIRWINTASAMITQALGGRVLHRERVIETIHGRALRYLLLERYPIITLHSVKADGIELFANVDPPRARIADHAAGLVELVGGVGGFVAAALDQQSYGIATGSTQPIRYEVEHTAGYVMPGSLQGAPGDPALPLELSQACLEIVRELQAARSRPAGGVTSEKLGDAAWTYDTARGAVMNPVVQDLLRGHRRVMGL